ncbi:MAG: SAM-dependent chlorinase/fluorinase [Thermodesulfobacteriota bacterium]
MKNVITLITDFGTKDHYAGVMKGVILGINPDAVIVDITHEIEKYNIFEAAFKLRNYYGCFPHGTVHVAVVDPGVGGPRRPIAIEAGGYFFVGPDNGIFSPALGCLDSPVAIEITRSRYMLKDVSATFHGRDIFAPAAAHISSGVGIRELGDKAPEPVKLEIPQPSVYGNEISGEVLYADSFGNLITNIPGKAVGTGSRIYAGRHGIDGVSGAYGEAEKGELVAIIGSSGLLEISVNQGSARELMRGKRISVRVVTE